MPEARRKRQRKSMTGLVSFSQRPNSMDAPASEHEREKNLLRLRLSRSRGLQPGHTCLGLSLPSLPEVGLEFSIASSDPPRLPLLLMTDDHHDEPCD